MVRHQAIGNDADAVQLRFAAQQFQESALVAIIGEYVLSMNSPVRRVVERPGERQPGKSHGPILSHLN